MSGAPWQLLNVNAEGFLIVQVGRTAMEFEYLMVKALSVPLILGGDAQRYNVATISPKTQTIK